MWKFLVTLLPYTLKTLGSFRLFGDVFRNAKDTQKNVTLFHLGHWVRIRVGGTPYIVRRKTLSKYPGSVLSSIALDDKITTKSFTEFLSKPFMFVDEPNVNQKQFLEDQLKYHLEKEKMKSTVGDDESNGLKGKDFKKNLKNKKSRQSLAEEVDQVNLTIDDLNEKYELESQAKIMNEQQSDQDMVSGEININESISPTKHVRHKLTFEKDHDGYYLIDRESQYFQVILNYLRTGEVFLPSSLDIRMLLHEAKFYHLYELESVINKKLLNAKRLEEKLHFYKTEFVDNPFLDTSTLKSIDSLEKIHYYLIPKKWFDCWKRFIDGNTDHYPPETIDSRVFFKSFTNPSEFKENLAINTDYIYITKGTWLYLNGIYRFKGPIIIRSSFSSTIYDPPPLEYQKKLAIWDIK